MLLRVVIHFRRGRIAFLSSAPSFVREYSTRGGISAKDSRLISPSVCSSFSVSDRVFGLTLSRVFIKLVNRSFPLFPNALIIISAHFLLMMSMTPFTGQKQVLLCFSIMHSYFRR